MKHLLIYSVRQIRYMIVITLILFAVAGAFCIHTKAGAFQIMKVYEMFLLPFSACWVICGYWDYIDPESMELFCSYPRSRICMGTGKLFLLMCLFLSGYTVLFLVTFRNISDYIVYFGGMCSEIFFWCATGFLSTIVLKNAGAAICIVWIYTAAQILDVEKNFSFLAIYMYEEDTLKSVQHKEILLIFLGSICTVLGQRRMNQLQVKEG